MATYFKLTEKHKKNTKFIIQPRDYGKTYFMVEKLQREIEKMERFCGAIPENLDDFIGEFWKGITLEKIRSVKYALKCFMEYLEGGSHE